MNRTRFNVSKEIRSQERTDEMLVLQDLAHGERDVWRACPIPVMSTASIEQGQILNASLHSVTYNTSAMFQDSSGLRHNVATPGIYNDIKHARSPDLFHIF